MRILTVNKYLFRRDGVTTVVEETLRLLGDRGHEVLAFGQADPRNFTADLEGAYVRPVRLARDVASWRERAAALTRLLFGWGARSAFARLIEAAAPDIVHGHNIYHHLAPPLIGIARRRGIPVVMTLHDYKPFCPAYREVRLGMTCRRVPP